MAIKENNNKKNIKKNKKEISLMINNYFNNR